MIAIIDSNCFGACLNFIDGLKAMQTELILLGQTTSATSLYTVARKVNLLSGKGVLVFPIKVYRNRPRGNNVPYVPDIDYNENLQNTKELKNFIIDLVHERFKK